MCRAKKSREDDSLVNLIDMNWKNGQRLEVSSIAIDPHSLRGREKFGRFGDKNDGKEVLRIENWFSTWAKIENEAYPDKWRLELEKIWKANASK
jgi:hypothetical protein